MSDAPQPSPCTSCGACCACEADWPRFSLETEEEIAAIPLDKIAPDGSGMDWTGESCAALDGIVGVAVRCTVYAARPIVCRDCMPGDDACTIARERYGMPPLPAEGQ